MLKTKKIVVTIAVLAALAVLIAPLGSYATGEGVPISQSQAPSPPAQPSYGVRGVMITVDESGNVLYELFDLTSTPNATRLGMEKSGEPYNQTFVVQVNLQPSAGYASILVSYFGDREGDAAYLDYAQNIKQEVADMLSDFGFSISLSGQQSNYFPDSNVTVISWEYSYSGPDAPFSKLSELSRYVTNSTFAPFLELGEGWEANNYVLSCYRMEAGEELVSAVVMEARRNAFFSGNGTHTFSLKNLTGMEEIPVVPDSDYAVQIDLPPDAVLNADSIDTGGADYQVSENLILVTVASGTQVQDITFSFQHAFPAPEEGEEAQPGEGEEGAGGISVGSYAVYAVVGILAVAVAVFVAKKVLS